jgi:hypothetical protein
MRSHKDRVKLHKAGFSIVRVYKDTNPIRIVMLDMQSNSWKTWKSFDNMNQLNKELSRIDTEEPNIIIE